MRYGFTSKWYGTFDQVKALGGMVKRRPEDVEPGQWGCHIVFFREIRKRVSDNEEREESFRLLRTYTVFCADQCEGLDEFQVKDDPNEASAPTDFDPVEDLIRASGAAIHYSGDRAFYCRPTPEGAFPNHTSGDFIQVPQRKQFLDLAGWRETILHELCHWTECRTGFDKTNSSYAFGELAAELGAAFLSAEFGVRQGGDVSNTAAYLKSWIDAMKADSSYIFKASTWASKATDFLLSFLNAEQPATTEQAA
jgi:antirestriction protein ArdC